MESNRNKIVIASVVVSILIIIITITLAMLRVKGDNTPEEQHDTIEQEQEHYEPIETLKITKDMVESALNSDNTLASNFEFVTDSMASDEDTESTWVYTGSAKEGATFLEDSTSLFVVFISCGKDKAYPNSFGITLSSKSEVDFDNMTSWAYKIIGSLVPTQLSAVYQNSPFTGISESVYSTDSVDVSVFKDTNYIGGDTVEAQMSILIHDKESSNIS